jgi:glycogen debranching enzyme
VDKERVGDPSQRPTDDHYRRYAVLVKEIADSDFGPGPLAVYDPMMTAILARAEEDLEWLADRLDYAGLERGRGARLKAGLMSKLYNPELERFSFYDAAAGQRLEADVVGAYLPAMLDLPVRSQVLQRLRESYWTEWPLPSTAPDHPEFDPVRYWRGPTWVNVNWLLADSLPGLKERTLELIERSGFREYFNPLTGEGLGASQFTWTAALALDWLRR